MLCKRCNKETEKPYCELCDKFLEQCSEDKYFIPTKEKLDLIKIIEREKTKKYDTKR